jgi:CBS domain-containing protein
MKGSVMATVEDILDKKGRFVAKVSTDSTIREATQEMVRRRIGSLVICSGDKVVGIFTERDVMARVVAEGIDPANTPVGQVMTAPVACCLPETTLNECRDVMTEKRIRHLPVVKNNELMGIVTIGDLMAQKEAAHLETIKYLSEYIYGPQSGS